MFVFEVQVKLFDEVVLRIEVVLVVLLCAVNKRDMSSNVKSVSYRRRRTEERGRQLYVRAEGRQTAGGQRHR